MICNKQEAILNSPIWDVLADWNLNEDFESSNTDCIQAAFDSQCSNNLVYRGHQGHRVLYNFTRLVAAYPASLRLHTQRIYLAVACGNQAVLEGAFIDFLLTLGSKGDLLKRRLFQQVSEAMTTEVKTIIQQVVEGNDLTLLSELSYEWAVLSNGSLQEAVSLEER